jgi:hypothetical protein
MASWNEFAAGAPAMAEAGGSALEHGGEWDAFLTTVAGDDLPRTHPINVGIAEGRLLAFTQANSAKTKDLRADGRYALHAFQDPARPHEFLVRGHVRQVTDPALRAAAVADWPFSPGDDYPLWELDIEHALFGERGDPNAWPPRYTSWRP